MSRNSQGICHWVIIRNWPGLDAIYFVKLNRTITLESIQHEFSVHISRCPMFMDKVLFALKQNQIGKKASKFIKSLIAKVLDNPEGYFLHFNRDSFEDYCINEYCDHMADDFIKLCNAKIRCQSKALWKAAAIEKWRTNRERRKINEAYLMATFAEDFLRSTSELNKVFSSFKSLL